METDGERLEVELVAVDGTDFLKVTGEIDIATVRSLDSVLAGLSGHNLVVDLREVTFMDSTGLHSLLRTRTRVQGDGGEVRLVLGEAGHIRRLLYAAGVLDQFLVDEDTQSDGPGWSSRLTRKRIR